MFQPLKNKNITSLFDVINNTSTIMGERMLTNLLYNPIKDVKKLNLYYDVVEELMDNNNWKHIEKLLRGISDLDRLVVSVYNKVIKPRKFYDLFNSYSKICKIYNLVKHTEFTSKLLPNIEICTEFTNCRKYISSVFDILGLKDCTVKDDSIEYGDRYPLKEAEKEYEEMLYARKELDKLAYELNKYIEGRGQNLEFTDEYKNKKTSEDNGLINLAHGFLTTQAKGDKLEKLEKEGKIKVDVGGKLSFFKLKSLKKTLVTSPLISKLCQIYEEIKNKLKIQLYEKYFEVLDKIGTYTFFDKINYFVSRIDLLKSHAKTSIKNKYFKPFIIDETPNSFVQIKDLRHPLVERLREHEYITNDIFLSNPPQGHVDIDYDKFSQGYLLYGANQSGKSTLAKSVGLCVLMAQIGCFTPGKTIYKPYSRIITRLSGNDNLIEGKSSFIVELSELETVDLHTDSNTLMIGDELCRGTDIASGTGIITAVILLMIKKKSSFISSTHMHHLTKIERINNLSEKELNICHLDVECNIDKILTYHRKIKKGTGMANYGIETARSFNFSTELISISEEVRKEYLGLNNNLVETKKSHYNSKVYMDRCLLCGLELKETDKKTLHTHHIKEQNKADKNGFIDYVHKNNKLNLVRMCEDCHLNKLHMLKYKIDVVQTSIGKKYKLVPDL